MQPTEAEGNISISLYQQLPCRTDGGKGLMWPSVRRPQTMCIIVATASDG